ncbi:phage holin family protein [Serinibacter arcticus]|uniref:Putative integral membrane protein n=1 Tax=Serinibacter arcticus TaxID=1655435 RepID=A0A4Z1E560_9MICO|nr:phage holin family protein [Serinibacter arcticus]TGO05613.1 putative integral membrane protein [Serinibacter arcticus]
MASGSPLQPTLGELIASLSLQLTTLVKGEVELAKAQVAEKGKSMGLGIGLFVGAGLFGFFAFAVLIATAVLGIATALPAWLSALIVGVALLLFAGLLAFVGKKSLDKAKEVKPEPVANLKQDIEIVKDGFTS